MQRTTWFVFWWKPSKTPKYSSKSMGSLQYWHSFVSAAGKAHLPAIAKLETFYWITVGGKESTVCVALKRKLDRG